MSNSLCEVCGRREPARPQVCDADRADLATRLRELPAKLGVLEHQLVPGVIDAHAGRVKVTRAAPPLPVRTDTLSLTGPGSEDVDWVRMSLVMSHAIRRWTTHQKVLVERQVDGELLVEERTIVCWQQELVVDSAGRPVLVRGDDQIGVVPPREWLDMWSRRWRRHFGHHVPRRTFPGQPPPAQPLTKAERQTRARVVLGMVGYVEPGQRVEDPLAEEWRIRFGEPARYQAMAADVRYLLTWLDVACDSHPDIGDMAAELRSLTAEVDRVLGETPDQQWLGRCPTTIVDRSDNGRRPCGAGLWQDPHASQIQCPRCRSTWGPDPRQILTLAGDIRRVWPLDRRRRYSSADRGALPGHACGGCGGSTQVRWREVTAAADRDRWWRIAGIVCPVGCPDAGKGV